MNFSEMEKIIENDKDGIEMIVIDYIIMLWLHEKGWLDENYNLTENAPLATAVNSTLSKIDLPQYQILLKLLGKRLKKTEDENKDLQLAVDLAIIEIEANYKKLGFENSNILRKIKLLNKDFSQKNYSAPFGGSTPVESVPIA